MPIVRRESLADQAAALLRSRLAAGEWAIGERLPGETTLAPQLGVGRSTVREAIRQLAGQGMLASRQGAGVFVIALEAAERWSDVVERAGIVAVLDARTAIEVEAAALAAERRTAAQLRRLRGALAERARHRAGIERHVETDLALHRGIVLAANSPILLELFDDFAPRSRVAMADMLRIRGHHGDEADQAVHAAIVDAIQAGDAAAAAARTRAHLQSLRASLG